MFIHLQKKETTTEDSYFIVDMCLRGLPKLRTDSSFQKVFDSVKEEALECVTHLFFHVRDDYHDELMMVLLSMYIIP